MAWNQNIPQPTDQLSQSQNDLLNNFQAIQTLVDVNHVDFNAGPDQGKHKWVTFPVQAGAPAFNAGEEGLYNLNNATTTKNELYIHKQTSVGTQDIPMSASILSTNFSPGVNSSGWSYLPSGFLIKWGTVACPAGSSPLNIIYPASGIIPAFTVAPFAILLSISGTNFPNSTISLSTALANTAASFFVLYNNAAIAAGTSVTYLAIGR